MTSGPDRPLTGTYVAVLVFAFFLMLVMYWLTATYQVTPA